jgi:glycosyltransferase involved in cell wall biosynthesis
LRALRILFLSWRDIRNPAAGGAEVFMHEVGRRWVDKGHVVTVFTARYKGCRSIEYVDGIRVIRRGNGLTVYILAWIYCRRLYDNYDIIVEVKDGGLPWLSRKYSNMPVVGVIHQTGRSFDEFNLRDSTWFYELPPMLSLVAYVIEPLLLRYYRGLPIVAVSESTANDLVALGLSGEDIHIVHGGTALGVHHIPKKENNPTLIYVGRLKNSKRVHDIISAAAIVRNSVPDVKLWIIGKGDNSYLQKLKRLVRLFDLEGNVRFYGRVSESEKVSLLRRAHVIVIASIREGWGLVVTEANAYGVPAVGYDVAGLRDAVRNGETGLLAKSGDVQALAEDLVRVLHNPQLWQLLSQNSIEFSRNLSWDRTAKEFLRVLTHVVNHCSSEDPA